MKRPKSAFGPFFVFENTPKCAFWLWFFFLKNANSALWLVFFYILENAKIWLLSSFFCYSKTPKSAFVPVFSLYKTRNCGIFFLLRQNTWKSSFDVPPLVWMNIISAHKMSTFRAKSRPNADNTYSSANILRRLWLWLHPKKVIKILFKSCKTLLDSFFFFSLWIFEKLGQNKITRTWGSFEAHNI